MKRFKLFGSRSDIFSVLTCLIFLCCKFVLLDGFHASIAVSKTKSTLDNLSLSFAPVCGYSGCLSTSVDLYSVSFVERPTAFPTIAPTLLSYRNTFSRSFLSYLNSEKSVSIGSPSKHSTWMSASIQTTQDWFISSLFASTSRPLSMQQSQRSAFSYHNSHRGDVTSLSSLLRSTSFKEALLPTVYPTMKPQQSVSFALMTFRPTQTPTEKAPTEAPTTIAVSVSMAFVSNQYASSAIPTVFPSQIPSISLSTSILTTLPSADPTTYPSTITPSVAPTTFLPSIVPSVVPTVEPSAEPTSVPTVTPTVTPSTCPTVLPTLAPTLAPSVIPTSTTITISPTLSPTLDKTPYQQSVIYAQYLQSLKNLNSNWLTFSNFAYQGSLITGTCSQQSSFFSASTLDLPLGNYFFSSLEIVGVKYDFAVQQTVSNFSHICSSRAAISNITQAIISHQSINAVCGTNIWRVLNCTNAEGKVVPSVCVNCFPDCATGTCSSRIATKLDSSTDMSTSCNGCFQQTQASYFVVKFHYDQQVLYPQFLSDIEGYSSKRNIVVDVNISSPGLIYCGAFQQNRTVDSVQTIKRFGSFAVAKSAGVTSVDISSLAPDSLFDVYCFSTDPTGVYVMPWSVSNSNVIRVRTLCCKAISVPLFHANVEASSSFTSSTPINTFSLEALPSFGRVIVNIILRPSNCSDFGNSTASPLSVANAIPSSFQFTPSTFVASSQLSRDFVVIGNPGCFQVVLYTVSESKLDMYENVTKSILIRSSITPPGPPSLISAQFSNDGLKLTVTLDSPSDQGLAAVPNYLGVFNCSYIVTFPGSSTSRCYWTSPSTLVATLLSEIVVGNYVSLVPGSIGAQCPQYLVCKRVGAKSKSVLVSMPPNPIAPVVSLSAPSSISSCTDLELDPTSTIGNGGRDWMAVDWTVATDSQISLSNITAIFEYLNMNFQDISSKVAIPNSLLSVGTYTFSLEVTNFLNITSFSAASVTIVASKILPTLSIVGPSIVNMFRWQELNLVANSLFTTSCATDVIDICPVYQWDVYNDVAINRNIKSNSRTSRIFRVAPYSLNSNTNYLVRVSLFSCTSVTYQPLTANSVIVSVSRSGVIATISGGSYRTLTAGSTVLLDGTLSNDIDFPDSQLHFIWGCSDISGDFGASCSGFASSNSSMQSWSTKMVSVPPSLEHVSFSIGLTIISNDGFSSDSAAVTLNILSEPIPTVFISSLATKYNPADNLVVAGYIQATQGPVVVQWSCSTLNLRKYNLTAVYRTFDMGTISYQLVIAGNSFVKGMSYQLQLTATYFGGSNPSVSGVKIVMNSPPFAGVISVTPPSGTSLNTSFYFATSRWVDDASDYPLSYVFSYSPMLSTASVLVKNRDVAPFAYAVVGRGLEFAQYTVVCFAIASDTYGSSANTSTNIAVFPASSYIAASTTSKSIESALRIGDPVAVTQVIGAVAMAINAVNCSVPYPCSSLNRRPCVLTPTTCGPCKDGYFGSLGDANSMCYLKTAPAKQYSVGRQCTSDNDCESFFACSSNICQPMQKECVNNCTLNGVCRFTDQFGNFVPSCSIHDSYCTATCHCIDGFHGIDCQYSSTEYSEMQAVRDSLCAGLLAAKAIQDESVEVVSTRLNMISNIMVDPFQVSYGGFAICSNILFDTVTGSFDYLTSGDVIGSCFDAYSNILSTGTSFPDEMVANLSQSLAGLSTGLISLLAEGQAAAEYSTVNFRLSAALVGASMIGDGVFAPPQTELEQFTNQEPKVSFALNSSHLVHNADADIVMSEVAYVGVSTMQFTRFPKAINSSTYNAGILLSAYGDEHPSLSSFRRKLLGTSGDKSSMTFSTADGNAVTMEISVKLSKISDSNLVTTPSTNGTVVCVGEDSQYNVSIYCPGSASSTAIVIYEIMCNGSEALVHYKCPITEEYTVCSTWDQDLQIFGADSNCVATTLVDNSTECVCAVPASYSTQFADSSKSTAASRDWSIFSGQTVTRTLQPFELSIHSINFPTISRNKFVLYGILVCIILMLCGLVSAVHNDSSDLQLDAKFGLSNQQQVNHSHYFVEFLNCSKPALFQKLEFSRKYYDVLLEHHEWLWHWCPYKPELNFRTSKFISVLNVCVHILFFDTVIVYMIFNANEKRCPTMRNESNCHSLSMFARAYEVCTWHEELNSCSVNLNVSLSYDLVLLFTAVVVLVTLPLISVCRYLCNECRNWFCASYLTGSLQVAVPVEEDKSKYEIDIMTDLDEMDAKKPSVVKSIVAKGRSRSSKASNSSTKHKSLTDENQPSSEETSSDINDGKIENVLDIDELQSYTVTIMRAARLTKIISLIDSSTIEDEACLVRATLDEQLEQKMFQGIVNSARTEGYLQHRGLFTRFACYCMTCSQSLIAYASSVKIASHYINEFEAFENIVSRIKYARQAADDISQRLSLCTDSISRENMLIQQFSIYYFSSYQRFIMQKFFNSPNEKLCAINSKVSSLQLLYVFWTPVYLVLLVCLTIVFGVQLDARTNALWIYGLIMPIACHLLILTPLSLLIKWIGLASLVSSDVQALHEILISKVRLILLRRSGLMKHATSLIQHMNPACRAARKFPDLIVSRLLISLNSFDIPFELSTQSMINANKAVPNSDGSSRGFSTRAADGSAAISFVALCCSICSALRILFLHYWCRIPSELQSLSVDIVSASLCLLLLYCLGVIAQLTSPLVPILIASILVAIGLYRELVKSRRTNTYVVDSVSNNIVMTNNVFTSQVKQNLKGKRMKKRLPRQLQIYRANRKFKTQNAVAPIDIPRETVELKGTPPLSPNRGEVVPQPSESPNLKRLLTAYFSSNVKTMKNEPLYQSNESGIGGILGDSSYHSEDGLADDNNSKSVVDEAMSDISLKLSINPVNEESKIDIFFGAETKETFNSFNSNELQLQLPLSPSQRSDLSSEGDEFDLSDMDDNLSVMSVAPEVIQIQADDALDNLSIAKSYSSQFFTTFFKSSENYDATVANTAANTAISADSSSCSEPEPSVMLPSCDHVDHRAAAKAPEMTAAEPEKRVSIKYSRPPHIPLPALLISNMAPSEAKEAHNDAPTANSLVTGLAKTGAPSIKYHNPNPFMPGSKHLPQQLLKEKAALDTTLSEIDNPSSGPLKSCIVKSKLLSQSVDTHLIAAKPRISFALPDEEESRDGKEKAPIRARRKLSRGPRPTLSSSVDSPVDSLDVAPPIFATEVTASKQQDGQGLIFESHSSGHPRAPPMTGPGAAAGVTAVSVGPSFEGSVFTKPSTPRTGSSIQHNKLPHDRLSESESKDDPQQRDIDAERSFDSPAVFHNGVDLRSSSVTSDSSNSTSSRPSSTSEAVQSPANLYRVQEDCVPSPRSLTDSCDRLVDLTSLLDVGQPVDPYSLLNSLRLGDNNQASNFQPRRNSILLGTHVNRVESDSSQGDAVFVPGSNDNSLSSSTSSSSGAPGSRNNFGRSILPPIQLPPVRRPSRAIGEAKDSEF